MAPQVVRVQAQEREAVMDEEILDNFWHSQDGLVQFEENEFCLYRGELLRKISFSNDRLVLKLEQADKMSPILFLDVDSVATVQDQESALDRFFKNRFLLAMMHRAQVMEEESVLEMSNISHLGDDEDQVQVVERPAPPPVASGFMLQDLMKVGFGRMNILV